MACARASVSTSASVPTIPPLLKTCLYLLPCLILLFNSSCEAENILYPRQTLTTDTFLSYGYSYSFRMQSDCNLVLYDTEIALWSSGTAGQGSDCLLTMQNDGDLVVSTPTGTRIWSSNTSIGAGNYMLILQRDRNAVIYGGSIFATGTNTQAGTSTIPIPGIPIWVNQLEAVNAIGYIEDGNTLYSGQTLNNEEFLAYGKNYVFRMQSDCNLVLYDTGAPLWASNTGGLAQNCSCTLQANGNLVIVSSTGRQIWTSNTSRGQANYILVLQRDRNVVIYGPQRWSTGTSTGTSGVAAIKGVAAPSVHPNAVNRPAPLVEGGASILAKPGARIEVGIAAA